MNMVGHGEALKTSAQTEWKEGNEMSPFPPPQNVGQGRALALSNIRHLSSSPQTRQSSPLPPVPVLVLAEGELSHMQLHRKVQYLNFSLWFHCNAPLPEKSALFVDEADVQDWCMVVHRFVKGCVNSHKISAETELLLLGYAIRKAYSLPDTRCQREGI